MAKARVDTGPPRWRSRTIAGVKLVQTQFGDDAGWEGEIGGEVWCFVQAGGAYAMRDWRAFTRDHLTGGPHEVSLKRLVAWVVEHEAEWQAKLRVRRKAGTRYRDPVDNATKAS